MRIHAKWKHSILAVVLLAIAFFIVRAPKEIVSRVSGFTDEVRVRIERTPHAIIEGMVIPVELATSSVAIVKGLSGRDALEASKGMLFVFEKPDRYRFWMSGMRFPLDMIWIAHGKVVYISERVSEAFDPANPIFYSPPTPVDYVLEVNAGFAESHSIRLGDSVIFRYTN